MGAGHRMTVTKGRRAAARQTATPAKPTAAGRGGQPRNPQRGVTAAAGFAYESPNGLPEFTLTPAQLEIDHYVDTMGWVAFYIHIKAMLASMCPWRPEQRIRGEWVPSDDPRMTAIVDRILPPTRSQQGMRFRSIKLQASIGEHAFWPTYTTDRGLTFDIAHPLQLRRGQTPGTFGVQTRKDARPSTGFGYREYDVARLRRHWVPDDTWPDEAYSPLAAVLPEMRLYDALVRNVGRAAESRLLMNNILWLSSDDGSEPTADTWGDTGGNADPDDDTPATPDGDDAIDEILKDLAESGGRAFRDHRGNDMSSVLPFVMVHHTEPKMLELGRPIDKETLSGLTAAVEAAARGLNIPMMFLVSGEGAAKYWNDLELRRALHERAVYPELAVNNDFWTDYALRPMLRASRDGQSALRDDDPNEWRLGADTSAIDVKSDVDPVESYLAGVGSRQRAAAAKGISPDEMLELPPDVSEYEHFLYVKAAGVRAAFEVLHDQQRGGGGGAPRALPAGPTPTEVDLPTDDPTTEPTEPGSVSAGALAIIGRPRGRA